MEKLEQKPGTGVDRDALRRMLQLTPAERVKLLVEEIRNLSRFDEKMRIR